MMKKALLLFLVFGPSLAALAQGPPCWDKVPPNAKYSRRHVVSGDTGLFAPFDSEVTHSLSVDGLNVNTKLIDGDSYVEVEIIITNCSPQTVEVNPSEFSLSVVDAKGDRRLAPLDPTHFV